MNNNGTLVIAPIRPFSDADTFPSAYSNELKGGHHQVADLNDITSDRLQEGMLATVVGISAASTYKYFQGEWIDNDVNLSNLESPIVTTANISGSAFYGDGSNLTGIATDVELSSYTLLTTTNTISGDLDTLEVAVGLNTNKTGVTNELKEIDLDTLTLPIATTDNISGSSFYGDGTTLTGIASTSSVNSYTAGQSGAVVSANDGVIDLSLGNNFGIIPTGNITISNPSNISVGQAGDIFVDATTYTLSFGSYYKFAIGNAPTLTGSCILSYYVKSITEIIISEVIDYA
jgi:hypothetical protein